MRMKLVAVVVVLAAAGWAGYRYFWQAPGDAVFGAIDGYVFLANGNAPEVTVIDAKTDKLAGTLALPFVADQALVSRAIMRLIVSNRAERLVAIVDLPTRAVEANFRLPLTPDVMVLSPDGLRLAVADTEGGKIGLINFIDGTMNAVIDGLNSPSKMTFDADGVVLFVMDDKEAEIKMINARKGEILPALSLREAGVVPGAADLSALTRTPDGRRGFVTDALGGKGYVISFRDWTVTKTLELGGTPSRAYGTADGQFMLVANTGSRTISLISTERFDVVATLPGVGDVTSIATGFFETLAYVISRDEKKAVIIDLQTLELAGEVALEGVPGQAVADEDGKKLYVPLGGTGKLALIDVYNKKIGHIVTGTPTAPGSPAMAASNNYCH